MKLLVTFPAKLLMLYRETQGGGEHEEPFFTVHTCTGFQHLSSPLSFFNQKKATKNRILDGLGLNKFMWQATAA